MKFFAVIAALMAVAAAAPAGIEQTPASPLVQIIVNINQKPVDAAPIAVGSPVEVVEPVIKPEPEPVSVVDQVPEAVIVAELPSIPEPVIVAELPPYNPIDVIAISAPEVNPVDIINPIAVQPGAAGAIHVVGPIM